MRFVTDASWQRFGRVVIGGSPLRLFRTTARGAAVAGRIEAGNDVGPSVLVDRMLDAGAIHPAVSAPGGSSVAGDDVTVVTPQLGGVAADDGRIVVDDGSQPPLPGADIRLPVNRGPAAARNAGRAEVSTPLIAFVDADVTLPAPIAVGSPWLAPLLAHFDDPRVALVAPRIEGEVGSPLDLGRAPARIRAGTRVSYVPAAVMIVRTSAFDAIGGFDETLRVGEDVDFVWRLDEAGWRCRYEPAATVWHEPRSTVRARLRQHADYGTSAAPLALRHPGALSPVSINGWTAAAWVLVVLGRPFAGLATAVGSAAALIPKLVGVPPRRAVRIALSGHLYGGLQVAEAVRRVWWPIVAVGCLVSKRMRWVAVASLVSDIRSGPTQVAYGWGVWTGMWRKRTMAPIVPRLSAWPGRRKQKPPADRRSADPSRVRPATRAGLGPALRADDR